MKIKISKQKRVIKEQKEQVNEVAPAIPAIGGALARFAPKIIKGVGALLGGSKDSEKDAQALIDKSQLDPVVIKSDDLEQIEQILRSIEAKISDLKGAQTKDDQASPAYQKSMADTSSAGEKGKSSGVSALRKAASAAAGMMSKDKK